MGRRCGRRTDEFATVGYKEGDNPAMSCGRYASPQCLAPFCARGAKNPYDKIPTMRRKVLIVLLMVGLAGCALPITWKTSTSAPSGTVLFEDNFSSPTTGWERVKYAEGIMDYDGGSYHMQVNTSQVDFWSTPHKDFHDVKIEVDAGKLGGPDENRAGLICRSDGRSYYFFLISSDGYYALGLYRDQQALLFGASAMQYSNEIKTGAAINHLGIECSGPDLAGFVNGVRVASAEDHTLTHGDVGLLAGAFEQPGVDIVFDNFAVIQP